ncbi:MAG: energy transducer TonB [Bacteroidales bacterium]|nr:energy transducer TonB [Bacteroidales bacterium]
METKKSKKADLENKRGLFLELGMVIVLSIVLIAFEWTSRPSNTNSLGQLDDLNLEEEIIPITRQQQDQPPPPPPPPQVIDVLNIVEDDVELDEELDLGDMDADQNLSLEIVPFEEEEAGDETVFFIVEDMPTFMGGGQDEFRVWIQKNLRYPEIAAENGISGRVFVQFAVNSRGEVVDVKVVRGVDPALDAEAVRVIKSSPKWSPGKQRGKPVKVQFTFPIIFVLQ